jgi:hypothetical protein
MEEKLKIIQEISTWEYLSTTLTQEHQQEVRQSILNMISCLKKKLENLK